MDGARNLRPITLKPEFIGSKVLISVAMTSSEVKRHETQSDHQQMVRHEANLSCLLVLRVESHSDSQQTVRLNESTLRLFALCIG